MKKMALILLIMLSACTNKYDHATETNPTCFSCGWRTDIETNEEWEEIK